MTKTEMLMNRSAGAGRMSRKKEVIKLLKLIKSTVYLGNRKFLDALEYAINYLNQPEQQWIPCSERLPEESDGTVLVCFPDEFPYNTKEPYVNAKHNQRVRTAHYSQFSNTWYIGDFNAVVAVGPIEWMPLPEPYKEGREK